MRLSDWQRALESYLLGEQVTANAALHDSLVGSPTLSVALGLQIYHHAYRARLLGVLREDFPAVHYWLGDEQFDALARAYLQDNPSRHFSLRWLGERFADFIEQNQHAEQAPALVELARLEFQHLPVQRLRRFEPSLLVQLDGLLEEGCGQGVCHGVRILADRQLPR